MKKNTESLKSYLKESDVDIESIKNIVSDYNKGLDPFQYESNERDFGWLLFNFFEYIQRFIGEREYTFDDYDYGWLLEQMMTFASCFNSYANIDWKLDKIIRQNDYIINAKK